MSEEEMHFKRSHVGHDANDLHKHGGLDDAHEEKTAREDLEDAIEALEDEDEGVVEQKDNGKAIEEALAEEEPVEADSKEAPVEEKDWKDKAENKSYMTVDEVIEPKAKKQKGGAGWKVATFLFLLIAIAGCGAAAYLFFNNGKTEFLGRRITSESTEKKEQAPANGNQEKTNDVVDIKADKVIYLDGYDTAIKIPDTLTNVSFEYHQNNEGGCPECTWSSNYSTLEINAAYDIDAQSVAPFVGQKDYGMLFMGSITISSGAPQYVGSAPEVVHTIETDDPDIKYYVYYAHPQQGMCVEDMAGCREWESQSVAEIEKMLTTEENYIKINK